MGRGAVAEGTHRLMRLVVDLALSDQGAAAGLQDALADCCRHRVSPLIAACCDAIDRPGPPIRIDRLEVDIGPLDPEHPERSLIDGIAAALPSALARATGAGGNERRPDDSNLGLDRDLDLNVDLNLNRDLDLVTHFARRGTLPWWADERDPDVIRSALERRVTGTPGALRRLLQGLADDPVALTRIGGQMGPAAFSDMTAGLGPSGKALDAAAARPSRFRQGTMPKPSAPLHPAAPGPDRAAVLAADALLALVDPSGDAMPPQVAARALVGLRRLAAMSGGLEGLLVRPGLIGGESPGRLLALALAIARPAAGHRAFVERLLGIPLVAGPRLDWPIPVTIWSETLRLAALEPEASRPLDGFTRGALAACSSALGLSVETLAAALAGGPAPTVAAVPTPGRFPPRAPAQTAPAHGSLPAAALDPFGDCDVVYCPDAGIVLVWPFLARFFERLGLIQDQQFSDDSARARGVVLLHFLASRDAEPPEYALALAKVLCGLAPDALVAPTAPVTDAEANECETLLAAVIAHAEILGNPSQPAFRASFLARRGALGERDGAWLLRIERETFDILLQRLPWGLEWISLPWMRVPLRVEW